MKFKTIISQPLFWVNIIVIVIVIVKFALAWINPSGNPPSGGGVLYYSNGNIGIGTAEPAQKLTVIGTIESTSGGFKFPADASIRTKGQPTCYTTSTYTTSQQATVTCASGYTAMGGACKRYQSCSNPEQLIGGWMDNTNYYCRHEGGCGAQAYVQCCKFE